MRNMFILLLVLLCISGIADIYSVNVTNLIASSTLPDLSNKNSWFNQRYVRYSADKIFDNNPETAWSENVEGSGIGETISLELDQEIKVDSVNIMAGYFVDGLYKKNNRIRSISLQIPEFESIHLDLMDKMQGQSFKLPEVISFSKITMMIHSVYKGDKWDDTCLAEMAFSYLGKNIELKCPRIIFKNNQYYLPAEEHLPILVVRNDIPVAYFSLKPGGQLSGVLCPGHQMGKSLENGIWEFNNKEGLFTLNYSYYEGVEKTMGMEEEQSTPQLVFVSGDYVLLGINFRENYFSDIWDINCIALDFVDIFETW